MKRPALLAVLICGLLSAEDSPCFRGNWERTGSDGSAVAAKAERLWRYRAARDSGRMTSSPCVAGGRLYVGCDNDTLYCFDAEKGGPPLWEFDTRHPVFSSPVVADGRVYVGEGLHNANDAYLYCVDAETGKLVWKLQTKSHTECTAAVVGGRVYFGAGDDGLYCADAKTGEVKWQTKGMHLDSSPLVVEGKVIVGSGYGGSAAAAFDAETGKEIWKVPMPSCAWGPPALGPKGAIFAIGDGNFEFSAPQPKSELLCLAIADGAIVWRTRTRDAALAAAAVAGNRVYLGNRSGEFACYNAETGEKLWENGCTRPILSSAAVTCNAVVFGCDAGHVHAVDPENGKRVWRYNTADDGYSSDLRVVSSPFISAGRVYVGCNSGWLYCLGEKK